MAHAFSLAGKDTVQSLLSRKAALGRQYSLDRSLREALNTNDGHLGQTALAEVYAHWGDPLSASDEGFLRSCAATANQTIGPILQCGASLFTLLLGAICDHEGSKYKHVWCLESDPHWANVTRSWLTQYAVQRAQIIDTHADMFKGYTWHDVDRDALPQEFHLVICSGGRASPNGVIGVVQRLEQRLAKSFTILARDVHAEADLKFLSDWAERRGAKCATVDRACGFVKLSKSGKSVNL